MKKEVKIILPARIPVLRDSSETALKLNVQEFNLYFQNFIQPCRSEFDFRVNCDYGKSSGTFWQLSEFPKDVDCFDLTLNDYDEYGECVANAGTVIELYDRIRQSFFSGVCGRQHDFCTGISGTDFALPAQY